MESLPWYFLVMTKTVWFGFNSSSLTVFFLLSVYETWVLFIVSTMVFFFVSTEFTWATMASVSTTSVSSLYVLIALAWIMSSLRSVPMTMILSEMASDDSLMAVPDFVIEVLSDVVT